MRFKTRVVKIGETAVGGDNPIRIQSMTTTDTLNVDSTVEQIIRLQDHGCEIARVTVQGQKQALACEKIKNSLLKRGCNIPLVADIHFFPEAALTVADFVDKVRINPGNYIKYNAKTNFLLNMEEGFLPLIEKCKKLKKALRIGVNHGSLSDRILNLHGNTPIGMVTSALEYAAVCQKHNFHDLVFSMKASNPLIMIEAYRLLVKKMTENQMDYPLHLGVTEAGDEEDGVIKSSVGIGTLLLEGIGDTIRVSLTADPEKEILPAKKLAKLLNTQKEDHEAIVNEVSSENKKYTYAMLEVGDLGNSSYSNIDALVLKKEKKIFFTKNSLKMPILSLGLENTDTFALEINKKISFEDLEILKGKKPSYIFLNIDKNRISETRKLKKWLLKNMINASLIASFEYSGSLQDVTIEASAEIGSLLFDNIIDGICLKADLSLKEKADLTLSILQACRKRMVKTEFISCPGCGRTLYDIQEVTRRVKSKTSHLPGLKIAVMGCVVNGLGEMADADFGVVGSAAHKVDLYLGKTCVERNIDFLKADDKLIELLKKEGKWKEKVN